MTTSALFVRDQSGNYRIATDAEVVHVACASIQHDLSSEDVMSSPQRVKDLLAIRCANLEHEVFGVMYLNVMNQLIAIEELFRGSLSQTMVYPREVVKQALKHNADGVVLFHNHPSGSLKPSQADLSLTRILREALKLVDVSVRDHVIVAKGGRSTSFAEDGLI